MVSAGVENVRFDDVSSKRLLVALSGGADSVALLKLLCMQREKLDLHITAAHLNHGIRGQQADEDAAFCRELCSSLHVQLIEETIHVPALARSRGQGIETAAREARYAFLRRAKQACGAQYIALAHHLNDQAETILMHLLRGTGPEGVCGMARISGDLYRPLLETPKAALTQFLEESGISWREDATNALSDNPRNALRLHVLPEIEKSYPSAAAAIARYGRLARIESDFLARMSQILLNERLEYGSYGLRLRLNGSEDEAILRRAIRKIAGQDLPAEKVEALAGLAAMPRGRMEISGRLLAEKTPGYLYFLPTQPVYPEAVPLNVPGETVLPGICRITAETGDFPMEPGDPNSEIFNAAALAGAVVRTRRSGDRIRPLGMDGDKLLSDYLTDRKIDRPLREFLPLVAVENRILWACGVGMSHEARTQSEPLRSVRLKIHFITDEKAEVLL